LPLQAKFFEQANSVINLLVLIKSVKGEISVFSLSTIPKQQKTQEYPIKYNIVSERRQAYKSSSKKKIEIKAGEKLLGYCR
jgi:hypothetical protein